MCTMRSKGRHGSSYLLLPNELLPNLVASNKIVYGPDFFNLG